ncbi:hypothetical protein BU17DRAFT_58091 [Hysterangium stoloniferum]|nr:hypothetical protein BU17DRAFT_58091 [Hysterangium stoloniferum]
MLLLLTFLYISHSFKNTSPLPILARDGVPNTCTSPDQRTVWDIIWSCLATVFACSWVSVHPNLPEPNEVWWAVMLRRLELMFWAIIAPELIIAWSLRQWDGARRLEKKYRQYSCTDYVETDLKWTVTHGHFIQMGGYMLVDGQVAKGTLTPEHFKELLEVGKIEFPTISKEEINDRSKGDALSKALVIVQTTWFILQCIARKAQGLATTQIELLTLALATLNGIIYFLWWDKPLDIRYPVPIHMLETPINPINLDAPEATEMSWSEWLNKDLIPFCTAIRCVGVGFRRAASRPLKTVKGKPWFVILWIILFHWPWSAVYAIVVRCSRFVITNHREDGRMRIESWYAFKREIADGPFKPSIVPPLLGTVFGAIHFIGWFYTFPTHTEALLWLVCSVLITFDQFLFTVWMGFFDLMDVVGYPPRGSRTYLALLWFNTFTMCTFPAYLLARLGLLVEAFISLRTLPPKAYQNVEWTSFLPHI